MPYCVAPNCKNRSFSKSKKQCEIEIESKATFHLFPKNIERRRIWIDRIGLMNTSMPKYAYLCSCHFSPESFDRMSAFKVRLKDDAIPNVCIQKNAVLRDTCGVDREPSTLHPDAAKPSSSIDQVCESADKKQRIDSSSMDCNRKNVSCQTPQAPRCVDKATWISTSLITNSPTTKHLRNIIKHLRESHRKEIKCLKETVRRTKKRIATLKDVIDSSCPTEKLNINQFLDCNIEVPNDNILLDLCSSQSGSKTIANIVTRKRPRNANRTIDREAKKARSEGKAGTGRNLIPINARLMKAACLETCRKKCTKKISESDRQTAFDHFWKLANKEKQWECLNNWVVTKKSKNSSEKEADISKTTSETIYYDFRLPLSDKFISVCRTMFLNTLDISYQWLRTARKKGAAADVTGIIAGDKRGRHKNRPHKYPEEMKNEVRNHIASFPTIHSHYCRQRTPKMYLEESLSIAKMYRMYVEKVESQRDKSDIVSESMYTSIFNTEFNLGFFTRKKDL